MCRCVYVCSMIICAMYMSYTQYHMRLTLKLHLSNTPLKCEYREARKVYRNKRSSDRVSLQYPIKDQHIPAQLKANYS